MKKFKVYNYIIKFKTVSYGVYSVQLPSDTLSNAFKMLPKLGYYTPASCIINVKRDLIV